MVPMGNASLFRYRQKSFIGIGKRYQKWLGLVSHPEPKHENMVQWNPKKPIQATPLRSNGTASLSLKKDGWKTIILSFLGRKTILFSCELRTVSFREGNSQHHLSLSQPCLALLTWTLTKPSCNAFSSVSSTEFPSKYKMFKKAEKYLQFPRIPQSYSQMMTIGCPITSFA